MSLQYAILNGMTLYKSSDIWSAKLATPLGHTRTVSVGHTLIFSVFISPPVREDFSIVRAFFLNVYRGYFCTLLWCHALLSSHRTLKEADHQTRPKNCGKDCCIRKSSSCYCVRAAVLIIWPKKTRSVWPKMISDRGKNIVRLELEKNPHIISRIIKENKW